MRWNGNPPYDGRVMAKVAPFHEFAPIALAPREGVFVLTGAGVSAESGIRTFRDANGMWEEYRFEEVASPEGWARDAELVWRFYSERRAQAAGCAPNAAHLALARLERSLGARLFLCTQNVDPLHERAGSAHAVHMHGELFRSRCESCDAPDFVDDRTYFSAAAIPSLRVRSAGPPAHRLVRRGPVLPRRDCDGARLVRRLRDDWELGRRVPSGGVRAAGTASARGSGCLCRTRGARECRGVRRVPPGESGGRRTEPLRGLRTRRYSAAP